ncbi:MAG: restriction endonuclease [Cenarchaeum symbiont of Oopsacas minuta]|nr:restriction endonuclease [Cenarchaeum symbiont of Oopsacas minuta]
MKRYEQLVEELKKIKNLGYVKTHRANNTGVGKTLEDLLGIPENNFPGSNGDSTELKSVRKNSSSMLSLFTKSPKPRGVNNILLDNFGIMGDDGKKRLHTTVNATKRNTLNGKDSFIINIHDSKIELDHPNYGKYSTFPYWEKTTLKESFERKYPQYLLYVKADHRKTGSNEEFHYNEAWLMRGFDFNNFIKLLIDGKIYVDVRIGFANGRAHDHGTGFRVKHENLDLCFSNRHKVL